MNDSTPSRPHADQREEIARLVNEIQIKLLDGIRRDVAEGKLPGLRLEAYEALCPTMGEAFVSSRGEVTGEPSRVLDLTTALVADAALPAAPATAALTGVHPEATTVGGWGTFQMGFNAFPHGDVQLVGDFCTGRRDNKQAWLFSGSGSCSPGGWFTSEPNDCRFLVNWQIGGFQTGTCYWQYTIDTCGHAICQTGGALPRDCSDCANKICTTDPYCCTTAWDSICVGEVNSMCSISC